MPKQNILQKNECAASENKSNTVGPVATGGHSEAVTPKISCSQKICFKNMIKTKIVPP